MKRLEVGGGLCSAAHAPPQNLVHLRCFSFAWMAEVDALCSRSAAASAACASARARLIWGSMTCWGAVAAMVVCE